MAPLESPPTALPNSPAPAHEATSRPPDAATAPQPTPPAPPPNAAPAEPACVFCPVMVRLPGGSFLMGSPADEPGRSSDERQHRVTVGPFAIGKYEVTQAEWRAVMGNHPSYHEDCDRCPVEQVSWYDAQAYIEKLNARTGRRYRLPTEAEWEYACRADGHQRYCGADDPDPVAWYYGNSGSKTHPVGQKRANAFGMHDISGNVWEWTCSAYTEDGYDRHENNCINDATSARVVRGGSWGARPHDVRAANRHWFDPTQDIPILGFRVAQD